MEQIDRYKSIKGAVAGIYKEKGSKFISHAAPVSSVDDAMGVVDKMRRDHPKARHHCFAYRIGVDQSLYRFNDDGEPSGTAGKPILGQIDSFDLSDIVVVVARYFGGKLLGASGLATAYKLSAHDALCQAEVEVVERRIRYAIEFSYKVLGVLMDALNRYHARIEWQDFSGQVPSLIFSLPISHSPLVIDQIISHTLGVYPEEVKGKKEFDLIKVKVDSCD